MSSKWTDSIIQQWTGLELNPGTTLEAILKAEAILGYSFPDDFKELYLRVDGFANWDWLPNMFSIWPIERILAEYNEESNKDYIGFCDYLINSHRIGFLKSKCGVFVLYGVSPDKVADTFLEAMQLINSDSEKIY